MKSYEITAIASAVVIVAGLAWYIKLVIERRIKTVVASWLVSTVALTLSLITYYTSKDTDAWRGALNLASAIAVASTLVAVYIRSRRDGLQILFNPFQIKCLLASALITILWVVLKWGMGKTGFVPNLLTQLLLVISYAMLIVRFWSAAENTEALLTWWCIFISSVIGLVTALIKTNTSWYLDLAFWYAMRSTVMCGILIFTLYRIEWRNRFVAELSYDTHRIRTL